MTAAASRTTSVETVRSSSGTAHDDSGRHGYAGHPMPKRNRVRARARRTEAAPQVQRVERVERPTERAERARGRYRGAPLPPGGSHAMGDPSPTLERAATLERAYVVKDFGRLGKVVVVMIALLIASGVAVNNFVK